MNSTTSGRKLLLLAVLAMTGCNASSSEPPALVSDTETNLPNEDINPPNDNENCRSIPVEFETMLGEFDADELTYRTWIPNGEHESGYTRYYDSVEDFVREGQRTGRKTLVERYQFTGGPTYQRFFEYAASQDQLVKEIYETTDHGVDNYKQEIAYDTWDSDGRPLRAFVDEFQMEDHELYSWHMVCTSSQWLFEYDDEAKQVITRVSPGTGEDCSEERVVRESFDNHNFRLREEIWSGTTEIAGEPDKVYSSYTVVTRENICINTE